jgi:hypothetical protein
VLELVHGELLGRRAGGDEQAGDGGIGGRADVVAASTILPSQLAASTAAFRARQLVYP